MRKPKLSSYFVLILFLFFLSKLPTPFTHKARNLCIAAVTPSWELCRFLADKIAAALIPTQATSNPTELEKQLQLALEENHLLQVQLENMKEWLFHEDRLEEQMEKWKEIQKSTNSEDTLFFQRRQKELTKILQLQLQAIPAKVIYREPTFWSSTIWVNVGEKNNIAMQKEIIGKNSAVTIGNILVGVVEEVGFSRSKIRLITDAKLAPSVRAIRGSEQNQILSDQIESLLQILQTREELFSSKEEKSYLYSKLHGLKAKTTAPFNDLYLAKGEIYGGSFPLWRSRGELLKGVGFNYDFADEEGPSRDLRTGKILIDKYSPEVPLLQEGDLLITTGLDGIFLPGLQVAVATKIEQLQEGSSHYCLTAKSLIPNFEALHTVFILPPITQSQ